MNLSRSVAGLLLLLTPSHVSAAAALRGGDTEGNTSLMGVTLEEFLSGLVSSGDMDSRQERKILRLAGGPAAAGHLGLTLSDRSKQRMRGYLLTQVGSKALHPDIAEVVASGLALGGLFPSAEVAATADAMELNGPAEAVYDTATEGNMVRLGTSRTMVPDTDADDYFHNGIWGYAAGENNLGQHVGPRSFDRLAPGCFCFSPGRALPFLFRGAKLAHCPKLRRCGLRVISAP